MVCLTTLKTDRTRPSLQLQAFMTYVHNAGLLGGVKETEPFLYDIGNAKRAITIPIIVSPSTYEKAAKITLADCRLNPALWGL